MLLQPDELLYMEKVDLSGDCCSATILICGCCVL